jgi:hypothetical protein
MFRAFQSSKDLAHLLEKNCSRSRQGDIPLVAIKELDPELFLKCANLDAQRWL